MVVVARRSCNLREYSVPRDIASEQTISDVQVSNPEALGSVINPVKIRCGSAPNRMSIVPARIAMPTICGMSRGQGVHREDVRTPVSVDKSNKS